jgi:hypothetical protein
VGWRSYGTRSRLPPLAVSPPHPARYASDPPPPGEGEKARTLLRSRDTLRPSFANSFALKKERGRREDRVRAAPAVSCAKVDKKAAHEHTGSAETLRPSLRNGFTAYFVLSPARPELVCHRRQRDTKYHRRLDTCHRGVRTTRLCRPHHALFVKSASASTAPRPNVSDDGQRPLSWDGMARNKQLIWVWSQG